MRNLGLGCYYLSFADDDRFRGAVYIWAANATHAVYRTWKLDINPGGQVMILGPIPANKVPEGITFNELLSSEELDKHANMMTLDDAEKLGIPEEFIVPVKRMEMEDNDNAT